ncbi:hypothetical protein IWW36_000852 [Coemansia brasiliensis]|uniref:Yeast cell wall synthesis Kre9/Knh1-like N-terminal domain-containing protein n=1 Tax=Coemansia brasiliensis TaxID=2650707 RepID=A0A9W8M231_9FUNG|nr:hypothetical protein IWW36_000852 [Coemansia brasiliensis]
MKLLSAYSITLLTAMAAAKLQITLPNTHTEWEGGSMESIKWKATEESRNTLLSIELLEGSDPNNLNTVTTIAEKIPASSMQSYFNVPNNLKSSKNYSIKLVDDNGEEYYGQTFRLKGSKDTTSKKEASVRTTKPNVSDSSKEMVSQDQASSVSTNEQNANKSSSANTSAVDSKAMHKNASTANAAVCVSSSIAAIFGAAIAVAAGAMF